MRYEDDLSRVLKYALVPPSEIAPYSKAKEGYADRVTPLVLADYLDEHNDPRADIIRRSLGETKNDAIDFDQSHYPQSVAAMTKPRIYDITDGDWKDSGGRSSLSFMPVVHEFSGEESARAVRAVFGHAIDENGVTAGIQHYVAHFTPEEARRLADKLPDEHSSGLHALLDAHFGKRS